MEETCFVLCGYIFDDVSREKFFNIVRSFAPEIKDDFFKEFGYEYRHGQIVIISGEKGGDIQEGETFIGYEVYQNSSTNITDLMNELKDVDEFAKISDKEFKVIYDNRKIDGKKLQKMEFFLSSIMKSIN